ARGLLARRTAAVESLQQLRRPLFGTMEHHAALPAGAHLPAAAVELVAQLFLSAALVLGRAGNVFPRAPLDGQPAGRSGGGPGVCLQRLFLEPAHVAEPYRDVQLDALGRPSCGAWLAGRGAQADRCGHLRYAANAGGWS